MKSETLLDKAEQNLNVARQLYITLANDDEAFLNYVGYHLQQSVEMAIKYTLEMNGVNYPKVHDIDQLIQLAKQNNVDLSLGEYIDDHSEMFSLWEARTRYVLNYRLEKRKIDKALNEVTDYIEAIKLEYDFDNSIEI